MLPRGRLFILLFLINCLVFSLASSSSPHNGTRPRSGPSRGMTEDYDDLYGITPTPPSSPITSEAPELDFCDYDMCVEQQQTCRDLSERTGCLCPGMSSMFELPNPPSLSSLTQKGDGAVVVHWCAPTSILTHYIVSLKDKGKVKQEVKVEDRKRMVVLEDVRAGALVCVVAVNRGGSSVEDNQSCEEFQPLHSDSGLALKLGIIGGVVGLIVLLILGLLLWRHKTRRKSTARPDTEGVL